MPNTSNLELGFVYCDSQVNFWFVGAINKRFRFRFQFKVLGKCSGFSFDGDSKYDMRWILYTRIS